MHHLVVHAGAQRGRVAVIVQEGRCGMILADQLFRVNVQRRSGHARLHSLSELLEHLVQKRPRLPHFRNMILIFDAYHAFAPKTFRMSA